MATPVLDLTSPTMNIPPSTVTALGSSALGKDEFLKILVAQLANQDPTQPQDSTQFVAELAQFSSLEQQQQTVTNLNSLLMGQATANQTAASSFIGKDVTYVGGTMHFDGTDAVSGTATLATPADKVTIAVTDGAGNVVRTLQLGAQGAGNLTASWDGRNDQGVLVPAGDYTMQPAAFDVSGQAVPISLSSEGTVSGVAFQNGVAALKIGTALVKMSDVTSINERTNP